MHSKNAEVTLLQEKNFVRARDTQPSATPVRITFRAAVEISLLTALKK